jgi:CRP-like cAMP-binding protein
MASRRLKAPDRGVSLRETLIGAGLETHFADLLADMPHRVTQVEPRRPFRDQGVQRDEVMFVRSGILAKFKSDSSGRRQIVALRFAGEGILPRDGTAEYGIQAIVRSEVMIGRAEDFDPIILAHPEMQRFFWRLIQRNEAIGYEWLVNCGRRDSTARVAHLLCETAVRMHVESSRMMNPFTQQQIADITGQTSVNVNRVFADMERQGLITRKGREIQFSDWAEMRRVGSFQPNYLSA